MKKVLTILLMVAAMAAAASCACSSNSDKAVNAASVECTASKCAGCDKSASCADKVEDACCPGCDSTSVKDSCRMN